MGGPAVCDPSTPNCTPATNGQPAPGGLKQTWGLNDPPPLGSAGNDAANKFVTDFKTAIEPVNQCLLYTKVNATKPKHEAMVGKRDQKYQEFQGKLAEVNKDEAKAEEISKPFLDGVRNLAGEANTLKEETEKSLNAWKAREPIYTTAEKQIEELDKWGEWADMVFANARKSRADILKETNENNYDEAGKLLEQHLKNLKPLYDEYQKQKEAKQSYDDLYKKLEPKLTKSSDPMGKSAGVEEVRTRMESAAKAKDYVKARELLDKLALKVGDSDVLCFEGKVLRDDNTVLYKVLVEIAESKGVSEPKAFEDRLASGGPDAFKLMKQNLRQGLLQDILKGLKEGNAKLDEDGKKFSEDFTKKAEQVARELLAESKKTIEGEKKRLGLTGQMEQGRDFAVLPNFKISNADAAKATLTAAAELLKLAKEADRTETVAREAFVVLSAAQDKNQFELLQSNRPLVEQHAARKKQWEEASEAYESKRKTAVAANPTIGLFTDQPGVIEKLTKLSSMKESDLANEVGQQAEQQLANIKECEGEIGKRFQVWGQPHLMRVTLDQMNATIFQRQTIERHANEQLKRLAAEDNKKLFAVIAIGLGLLAAIPSGGSSLLISVSAVAGIAGAALALYQVGEQANDYSLAVAANATAFEKAKAISNKDTDDYELAMNCVLALVDVFAAAAAFKALNGLVKAVKVNSDVAAAMKLANVAESVGIQGAAKTKIVNEAVTGLKGEAIERVGRTMARSGDTTEIANRVLKVATDADLRRQLERSLDLMRDVKGRIPDAARKMAFEKGKVQLLNETNVLKAFEKAGLKDGPEAWAHVNKKNFGGFYEPPPVDKIFLVYDTEENLAGALIHEATHRMGRLTEVIDPKTGKAIVGRQPNFMTEAIAEFAERNFYQQLYGEGAPLFGTDIKSTRIKEYLAFETDEAFMAHIEAQYRSANPGSGNLFKQGDTTADQVVEQLLVDIANDYKANLPKR